jgi:hypothetical protein
MTVSTFRDRAADDECKETNANTANPSTIAAGVTEIPKIAGLPLLALIAAAQHCPCKMAM